ncbi:MAG: enolase C-terminal domain-like protein [Casimicrobiaceae bacterium]
MAKIAALEPVVVNVSAKTNWSFVVVTTDEGATGWGECSLNGWEPMLVAYAQSLAPTAAGCDLDAAHRLVRHLPHSPGGTITHAVRSATEQALVDLAAQAAHRSVAASLSSSPRAHVPAYANVNRGVTARSPAGFADAARRAVAAGYRAVKLAPFDGVVAEDAGHTPIDALTRAGIDRVFAVRDAVGPSIEVMVDCHWRFDPPRAAALLRDVAPAKPYWIECMISELPRGYPEIARLTRLAHEHGMRTAGGETVASADAAEAMCTARLYDVLMPDIKYAGGYAAMLAIGRISAMHGVAFAPHNPTGPIAHLASIHACAAAPELLWLEHQWGETSLFEDLVRGALPPLVDGAFVVPTHAGLGASLDRALAARHPYRQLAAGSGLDERLG